MKLRLFFLLFIVLFATSLSAQVLTERHLEKNLTSWISTHDLRKGEHTINCCGAFFKGRQIIPNNFSFVTYAFKQHGVHYFTANYNTGNGEKAVCSLYDGYGREVLSYKEGYNHFLKLVAKIRDKNYDLILTVKDNKRGLLDARTSQILIPPVCKYIVYYNGFICFTIDDSKTQVPLNQIYNLKM